MTYLYKRRKCFHHDHRKGESWIVSHMINTGMNKLFWCTGCGKQWVV